MVPVESPLRRNVLRWLGFGIPATAASAAAAATRRPDGPLSHVALIADLAGINPGPSVATGAVACDVSGYWEPADGGGGRFDWDPHSTAAPDGFMTFSPAGVSNDAAGRWMRRLPANGAVTFEMAGARADGVTDDWAATRKAVKYLIAQGGGLINLRTGRRYFLTGSLDLTSTGDHPIVIDGCSDPLSQAYRGIRVSFRATRIILVPGMRIRLGNGCVLRRVVVWRKDLPEQPTSLAELRRHVQQWFLEDGVKGVRSIGVDMPFPHSTVEEVVVIGFHTGIHVEAGDNRVMRCFVDAAGYGVECTNERGICEIASVYMGGYWGSSVGGTDAYGDQSWRPGIGIYAHDHTDGLLINNCAVEHWVHGLVLDNVWEAGILNLSVETDENNGQEGYAIWTRNEVRNVTFLNPRVNCANTCIRFSHSTPTSTVSMIGGVASMHGHRPGYCIQIDSGTAGQIIGTNVLNGRNCALAIAANVIAWKVINLQLWTACYLPWAQIDPSSLPNVYLIGTQALDHANQKYMQAHINERTLISYDSSIETVDGSSRAPLSVESRAPGNGPTDNVSFRRNGAEVGALRTTANGFSIAADNLGFFGVAPVNRPAVTGARGDNLALASLLTALERLGLVVDHTTR